MTMDDIKAMTDDWITPATAASAMKMDPGRLIEYARKGQLPFATQISGNRVKIGRKSFLGAYGYGCLEEETQETETEKQLKRIADALEMILQMMPYTVESHGRFAQGLRKLDQMKEAAQ